MLASRFGALHLDLCLSELLLAIAGLPLHKQSQNYTDLYAVADLRCLRSGKWNHVPREESRKARITCARYAESIVISADARNHRRTVSQTMPLVGVSPNNSH